MFRLNSDLIDAAHLAVESSFADSVLERFDAAQLVRGINALKAAQILTESDHWEFASGVARQLFDQLINMECLAAHPDRLRAVQSYALFGFMQAIRQQLSEVEYAQKTGRPIDTAHRDLLRGWLDANFDQFKGKSKADGSINFNASWTGKNSRQLASESPNTMRLQQYELLYREWSSEVHAAPATMLESLFREPGVDLTELLREGADKTAQLMAVTLNLFLDLWNVLPHVPRPSANANLAWLARIQHELGQVIDLSAHAATTGTPDI